MSRHRKGLSPAAEAVLILLLAVLAAGAGLAIGFGLLFTGMSVVGR